MDNNAGLIAGIGGLFFFLVFVGLFVVALAGMWKIFEKAGQPGWGCLVPIYNLFLLVRIVGKPDIWVLYAIIPFVNLIICILLAIELARVFGKGTGFGVGLIFLPMIFYPILGFGNARYLGPPMQGARVMARPA